VADFTLHRGGVYFEAGYALALGRTVIWCCRQDHADQLHFDTRQYPHILWQTPADLRRQLRDRLRYLLPGARQA
jgi:nucleoside 2-deoxyribosyltransferase